MAAVGNKNTGPELAVRRLVHAMGRRYVLHDPRLPGRPDLALPRWGKVVFVHGCFWHRHRGCRKATVPKSRVRYWTQKFEDNEARDLRNRRALQRLGWSVLVVWECELSHPCRLQRKLRRFLDVVYP